MRNAIIAFGSFLYRSLRRSLCTRDRNRGSLTKASSWPIGGAKENDGRHCPTEIGHLMNRITNHFRKSLAIKSSLKMAREFIVFGNLFEPHTIRIPVHCASRLVHNSNTIDAICLFVRNLCLCVQCRNVFRCCLRVSAICSFRFDIFPPNCDRPD